MPTILKRQVSTKNITIFHPGKFTKKSKIKKNIKSNIHCTPTTLLISLNKINSNIQNGIFFFGQTITQRQKNISLYKEGIQILNLDTLKNKLELYETFFQKEQGIRTILKRFVQIWLYKRYKTRMMNTEDPITLSVPSKPIYVYDNKVKGVFTFDAVALRKSIENNLTFTDWMFPEPIAPRNSLTNLPFSNMQLYEIIRQLRAFNATSWWLEAYLSLKMNLDIFKTHYQVPIKLNSLNYIIRDKKSEEYIENLSEFIERYHKIHEIEFLSHLIILKWAVIHLAEDVYMKKWSDLLYEFIKIGILNNISESDTDHPEYDSIHYKTYNHLMKYDDIARIAKIRLLSIANKRRLTQIR